MSTTVKGRGNHPNSLANICGGATPKYEELKKQRSLWVTDLAWNELNKLAKQLDITRPEIIERIARGVYTIETSPKSSDTQE